MFRPRFLFKPVFFDNPRDPPGETLLSKSHEHHRRELTGGSEPADPARTALQEHSSRLGLFQNDVDRSEFLAERIDDDPRVWPACRDNADACKSLWVQRSNSSIPHRAEPGVTAHASF